MSFVCSHCSGLRPPGAMIRKETDFCVCVWKRMKIGGKIVMRFLRCLLLCSLVSAFLFVNNANSCVLSELRLCSLS